MKTSLVITVLNEAKTIEGLLKSILKQIRKPEEVIIVDGGSKDKTVKIIKEYSPKFLKKKIHFSIYTEKGVNRARGRNIGVEKASGEIIAFTDAGCILDRNWLVEITKHFSDIQTSVVAGYYKGWARNIFEKCLIPYVLVMPERVNAENFLPSTRSMAIRREVFQRSGGFPINCDYNEDYPYALFLKRSGYKIIFAKEAIVEWLPRDNLGVAAKMFYQQAQGDVLAGVFRKKVLLIPFKLLIFPIWAWIKNYRYINDWRAVYWLPIIELVADVAVITGTIVGNWRLATGDWKLNNKISVVVLTKANDKNLKRCLESVLWADEIVVIVDTEDNNVNIVSNKIHYFVHPLNGNFSIQRNFGLEKASNEWILFLDSDEVLEDKFQEEVKEKLLNTTNDAFYLKRKDFFMGAWLRYGEAGNGKLIRLVKKNSGQWQGMVHEVWQQKEPNELFISELNSRILHYSYTNLRDFIDKLNWYSMLRVRELRLNRVSKRVWPIIIFPFAKFCQNYFWRLGFLDGVRGFVHAVLMSFHSFLVRAKLYRSF